MDKKIKFKKPLTFEWDKRNKDKNIHNHSVQNSESEEIFVNNPILLIDIGHSQNENRYLAYGVTDKKRQLVIVFTLRGKLEEIIRIISSRDQDKKEKELYQEMKSEVKNKK
jgi:uncharacterized DUF497 family protein